MPKYAAILWILTACFLTSGLTYWGTQTAIYGEIDRHVASVVKRVKAEEGEGRAQDLSYFIRVHQFRTCADVNNGKLFFIPPFLTCLWGAVSAHWSVAKGRAISKASLTTNMAIVIVISGILAALGMCA